MKTLKIETNADGSGLRSLIVEMDGVVSAIRCIIPRLLVAAQLESVNFRGETDEVTALIPRLDVRDGDKHSPVAQSSKHAADISDDGASSGSAGSSVSESHSEQDSGSASGATKPGKMRILELKVEGMAECLVDEYPARLPHDFF